MGDVHAPKDQVLLANPSRDLSIDMSIGVFDRLHELGEARLVHVLAIDVNREEPRGPGEEHRERRPREHARSAQRDRTDQSRRRERHAQQRVDLHPPDGTANRDHRPHPMVGVQGGVGEHDCRAQRSPDDAHPTGLPAVIRPGVGERGVEDGAQIRGRQIPKSPVVAHALVGPTVALGAEIGAEDLEAAVHEGGFEGTASRMKPENE